MDNGPIGKFQVIGTLGSGAHSKILHIRRECDKKQYALKVVPIDTKDDHKYLTQAQHEIKVAQMLDHPHLVKVYRLETPRDWLFRIRKVHLLIEYCPGKTLDGIKGLTIPRLIQVFKQIAEGLVHMHRRGVFHADLKPNNIILTPAGEVKIIDYGLAWIRGQPKGRVQGTPEYMAPEQSRGGAINERTDIYCLGATMYRLVTWRLPPSTLTGADGIKIDAKMFEGLLKPVHELMPQTPPDLCKLIHRCLSFNPNNRPERVGEVQGILDDLCDRLVKRPEDRLDAMEG